MQWKGTISALDWVNRVFESFIEISYSFEIFIDTRSYNYVSNVVRLKYELA